MISRDYIELMNGEMDGSNSSAESQRLDALIAADPEVRAYFKELREAVGIFDRVSLLDPPVRLRQRILSAVDELNEPRLASEVSAESGGLKAFLRNLFSRPGHRLAFTTGFAVSLLLTVVVWQLTANVGPIPSNDLSGAILREVESGRGTQGESVTIDLAGIDGAVRTYHVGNRFLIRILLNSDRTIRVRLRCNAPFACESYRATQPSRGEVAMVDQRIELTHTGQGDYDIVLQHTEALTPEVLLEILENQSVLFEATITRNRN